MVVVVVVVVVVMMMMMMMAVVAVVAVVGRGLEAEGMVAKVCHFVWATPPPRPGVHVWPRVTIGVPALPPDASRCVAWLAGQWCACVTSVTRWCLSSVHGG